jgi:hypothetical protein
VLCTTVAAGGVGAAIGVQDCMVDMSGSIVHIVEGGVSAKGDAQCAQGEVLRFAHGFQHIRHDMHYMTFRPIATMRCAVARTAC